MATKHARNTGRGGSRRGSHRRSTRCQPQSRTSRRSHAKQRDSPRPCANRPAMLRSKMPLRRSLFIRTARRRRLRADRGHSSSGCSRKESMMMRTTEAHRTAARCRSRRGSDRRSAGGPPTEPGDGQQPDQPQQSCEQDGCLAIQVRIARQRPAERPSVGQTNYYPYSVGRQRVIFRGWTHPQNRLGSGRRLIVVTQNFKPRPRF